MEGPPVNDTAGQRNIVALGFVSLFNDISSEMIYPIVPVFLVKTLQVATPMVGIIEGCAEATANVLKVFSGWFSDHAGKRKSVVIAGYGLSLLGKSALAFAHGWTLVLMARVVDRFGKGTRTAARDALLADSSTQKGRARAFGLHRSMDTAGAVVGPLLALAVLSLITADLNLVFLLAAIPSALGMLLLVAAVREPAITRSQTPLHLALSLTPYGRSYRTFVAASVLFGLGNSSDAFLILRSTSLGFSTSETIWLYVTFNVAYSTLAYPFGHLADRYGARRILLASFILFSAVYAGFALATTHLLWLLFPAYGLFMAMNEGVGKAYISSVVPANLRATAIGLYYALTGLTAFVASVAAGILWEYVSIPAPFYLGSLMAAAAAILLYRATDGQKSVA